MAHGSRDCKKSVWIIFQFCFIFTEGEKEGSKPSVAMDYRNRHKRTDGFIHKDNVVTGFFYLLKSLCIALLWFMYARQVWLDNLTLVTLLTINSLPFKHGLHAFNKLIRDNTALPWSSVLIKSAGGSDVFLYSTVNRLFTYLFFSAPKEEEEGSYLF